MNKSLSLAAVLLLAASASAVQGTSPAKPSTPAQQPSTPAPSATQPPAGTNTAPKVAKPPEAKTPEEFKAYQEAVAVADQTAAEAAVDAFAKTYPTSELRAPAYSVLLQKAYETNDPAKIMSLGRKVLAIEPDNAMTQVVTATALAESTKPTDLDYVEKYDEANKLADAALRNIDTMLPQPNITPEQFEGLKNMLRSMAHSAKGYMTMNKKDYAASEVNFQRAIDTNPTQSDPVLYLRLAVAQDNLRKYAPAFSNVTKALQLAEAQNNTIVVNLARAERDRLQKLMGSPAPAKAAPAATTPPKQ